MLHYTILTDASATLGVMSLLDFLFPKRCVGCKKIGSYLCANCFIKISFDVEELCLICNRHANEGLIHPGCRTNYTIDGAFASIAYNSMAKRLVHSFKYRPYLYSVREVLIDLMYEGLIQKEGLHKVIQHDSVLVPIPLHTTKLRERGYNQAKLLAKGMGKRFSLPVADILIRQKKTDRQFALTRVQRLANIKDAFALKKDQEIDLRNKTVFLIDDVVTSGATLNEAAKVLKRVGAEKVYGLTLAHGH